MKKKNITDGYQTTYDWQKLKTSIAILPLGSCEQHGAHLPLLTDSISAEYFGRYLAEELDAALLPTIPIGTSFEHAGFRGSFSFRPETHMAIIRDLADELERQNFTRLIIVNGHGGNQSIAPVVRDINRTNRTIKLILVSAYEYDTSNAGKKLKVGELHAGASETSRLMVIRPELVGDIPQYDKSDDINPTSAQDLNMIGFGVLRPSGIWGKPEMANKKAGLEIIASIKINLLKRVKELLKLLQENHFYGGKGSVVARPMQSADLADGIRLSKLAKWNQKQADWELFYRLNPEGCFVAAHNGKVVGTVATVNYKNKVSWISMVLVDPEMRRMGIGSLLLNAAINHLSTCECVKLDATPAGKKVYDKLGFKDEYKLFRLTIRAMPALKAESNVKKITKADLKGIKKLDAETFGVDRSAAIDGLAKLAQKYGFVAKNKKGKITGFIMGRSGKTFEHLGPIVADDLETAQNLLAKASQVVKDKSILIDVSLENKKWFDWLISLGFTEERQFIRMYLKANPYPGKYKQVWAISGPELG